MFMFAVEGHSETASFRVPENLTFHHTLPLPPRITVVGVAGAALGLDCISAGKQIKEQEIEIGVYGFSTGLIKDLWQFSKITRENPPKMDVLIREFLFDFFPTLIFASTTARGLEELRQAFLKPRYALTLGNSDDLFNIEQISEILPVVWSLENRVENVWLPGHHLDKYTPDFDLTSLTFQKSLVAPKSFFLPDEFELKEERRIATAKQQYTYIGSPVKLTSEGTQIVRYKEKNIPLLIWK
jgi:CRISPR-associated protein Cas5t